MTRWIGTTGDDPAESYKHVPATGEIRENDNILVVGAVDEAGERIRVSAWLCPAGDKTPFGGKVRNADVGLLYDPGRAWEKALCRRWRSVACWRLQWS